MEAQARADASVLVTAPLDVPAEGPVRLRSGAVVVTLASRVLLLVCTFATAVLLARGLGPADRGVLALAMLASQVLVLLCGCGVGLAAMHWTARTRDVTTAVRDVVTFTVLGSLAAAVVLLPLAWWLLSADVAAVQGLSSRELLVAGAAVPPGILLAGLTGVLRGLGRMRAAAVADCAQGLAALVLTALVLVVLAGGIEAALWAQAGGWVAGVVAALTALRGARERGHHDLGPQTRGRLRSMAGYGLRGDLGNLTYLVTMRFDTFVVNAVAGNAALGVYTVAARVADVVWLVPYSVALVVLPRASGGTAAELDRSTPRLAVRTLGLSLVVAVLLAIAAWVGLSAVFGAAFAGALQPLLVLLPGVAVFGFGNVLAADLAGRGQPGWITLNAVAGMVLTVVLDLLVIPAHGVIGAAAVSTAVYAVNAALALAFFLHATGMRLRTFATNALGATA